MIKIIRRLDSRLSAKILLTVSIASLLTACNRDMSDLNQYVKSVKARPAKPIEPIPVIKPYVRFIYPGHGADPFDVSVLAPQKNKNIPDSVMIDKNRVPEYLENFPLDSLRMVGTVYKEEQLWALIRVPSGAVHRVKEGNYMGENHGKILAVEDVSISLMEIVENGFGGHKERENEIVISNPNKKI
ncbi:MAG: pilus assembly protein PilP [Thiolinea sp.]